MLLGLIMVVGSLLILILSFGESNVFLKGIYLSIGSIGTLFFVFCVSYYIKQMIVGKKLFIANNDGFYDLSSAIAYKEFIRWELVEDIGIFTINGQSYITVTLFDGYSFLQSLPYLKRTAIHANLKLGSGHINIAMQTAKDVTMEELLEIMVNFHKASVNSIPKVEIG